MNHLQEAWSKLDQTCFVQASSHPVRILRRGPLLFALKHFTWDVNGRMPHLLLLSMHDRPGRSKECQVQIRKTRSVTREEETWKAPCQAQTELMGWLSRCSHLGDRHFRFGSKAMSHLQHARKKHEHATSTTALRCVSHYLLRSHTTHARAHE